VRRQRVVAAALFDTSASWNSKAASRFALPPHSIVRRTPVLVVAILQFRLQKVMGISKGRGILQHI